MTALADLLGRLDPDPVRRGRQFERICQWYLTHDPEYAGELRQVWLWKDWPGRWGADAGIDLVAEDVRGRLWAIQAKAINSRNENSGRPASARKVSTSRFVIQVPESYQTYNVC